MRKWLMLVVVGMSVSAGADDAEIKTFSDQYELDLDLARAVVIHESGGNGGVVSIDGARGYFQIMPATFRSLRAHARNGDDASRFSTCSKRTELGV